MSRVVVVSGAGRWADPWHPFAESSAALAGIARELGHEVRVTEDVDAALGRPDADLLVLNVGDPEGADPAVRRGLAAFGGPVFVSHVTVTSVPLTGGAPDLFGGVWVRGTTMHPERGPFRVRIGAPSPLTDGLADFEVDDEAYTAMSMLPGIEPLLLHGDGEPLLWRHGRMVVDLLGHDAVPYAEPTHRTIVARAFTALLADESRSPGPIIRV